MSAPSWYIGIEQWFASHRILATAAIVILLLVHAHPNPLSMLLGTAIVLLAEAGRIWASGHIEKNVRLATGGPYRFTRNPLYFCNGVIFAGFCIMADNLWAALLGLALFMIIYRPVLHREAEYMEQLFGEEYRHWAASVPFFFPKWTSYPAQGRYDWNLVLSHREPVNALAVLAGIALFAAIGWWRRSL